MPDAVVLVADKYYVDHAKALLVNCREHGQWNGDFCVIVPADEPAVQSLDRTGITLFPVSEQGFFAKFCLFDVWFRQWNACFYMDCDCLVQRPLIDVFGQLTHGDLVMHQEVTTGIQAFYAWDADHNDTSHQAIYRWLQDNYPTEELCYNTSCVLWRPSAMPDDLVELAIELQSAISLVNSPGQEGLNNNVPYPGGTDQQVLNLLLQPLATPVTDKIFTFWAWDTEHHYQEEVKPAVVHYSRWYAPWIVKRAPMAAYRNERLNVVCHEFYQQNLSRFDEVFA